MADAGGSSAPRGVPGQPTTQQTLEVVRGRSVSVVAKLEKVDEALVAIGKKSGMNVFGRLKKTRLLRERTSILKEMSIFTKLEKILKKGPELIDGVNILAHMDSKLDMINANMDTKFDMINSRLTVLSELNHMVLRSQFEPVKTISTLSRNVKDAACGAYGVDSSSSTVCCFVTGVDLPWSKIKTTHIYQRRWPNVILQRIGIDTHSASNLLLLWNLVEAAFDKFYLAIIPKGDIFIVHVLYLKIQSLMIDSHAKRLSNLTWSAVEGMEVQFPNHFCPAKRLLAFHATMAITFAIENGWMAKEDVPNVPKEAFGSPSYDKELMRAFLEDQKRLVYSGEPRHLDLGSVSSS